MSPGPLDGEGGLAVDKTALKDNYFEELSSLSKSLPKKYNTHIVIASKSLGLFFIKVKQEHFFQPNPFSINAFSFLPAGFSTLFSLSYVFL